MTDYSTFRDTITRRAATLGIACGIYAVPMWVIIQGRSDIAVGVAVLTIALITLTFRYGSELYP